VETSDYTPGVRQLIRVLVEHPEAMRWGFQLTARLAGDETRQAGSFTFTPEIRVRCAPTGDAPCGGVQFASHRIESTRLGTTGQAEWEIEWTPPATEEGDVVFYVAGNAANGNFANTTDRIYTSNLRVRQLSCTVATRPTLRSVANGGSFLASLSANSMISLFGLGFQPAGLTRTAGRAEFVDRKFPTQLNCVAVEVGGVLAPISHVRTDQINAQLPSIPDLGNVPVRVILNPGRPNEIRSDVAMVVVSEYSPAFFLYPGSRSIAGLFPNSNVPVASPAVVAGGRPAQPGDIVTLFGTGFGPTEPFYQAGEFALGEARIRDSFTVTVGGTQLAREDVLYGGLSPGSISGLYQFDIRLPRTLPDGDVPVVIRIGGAASDQSVTIPVRR